MKVPSTSDRMAEAMQRTLRHWEVLAKQPSGSTPPPSPAPFCVAISREAGVNGWQVAELLGSRLGWPVYDREIVQKLAENLGASPSLIEEYDEKRRMNWVLEFLGTLSGKVMLTQGAYTRHLIAAIADLAASGPSIFLGRGAAQILPPKTTLRVRLVAPREERIAALQQRFGTPLEQVRRDLDETDRERHDFIRETFQVDAADPANYDLILNTSRFPTGFCVELIVQALRVLESKGASASSTPSGAG